MINQEKRVTRNNQKAVNAIGKIIPFLSAMIVVVAPALAAEKQASWSDQTTQISYKEYFDLLIATKFQNLNPAEPISIEFVPNTSADDALIFIVRPVVTPDFDLTDESSQKGDILNNFRSNINKQATSQLAFGRKLMNEKSVLTRWPRATVERNLAIRFVKADNARETVAITTGGKTVFEKSEIAAETALLKPRTGELWVE